MGSAVRCRSKYLAVLPPVGWRVGLLYCLGLALVAGCSSGEIRAEDAQGVSGAGLDGSIGDAAEPLADETTPDGGLQDASADASDAEPELDAALSDSDATLADAEVVEGDGVVPSAGCGLAAAGTGAYEEHTLMVDGAARQYFLRLPESYDPERAYPLVVRFHGYTVVEPRGLAGGLEIEQASGEDAIVAAPSAADNAWDFLVDGPDMSFFDALLVRLQDDYCIDTQRVFAFGFSAGSEFSALLACVRGDVLRGVAGSAAIGTYAPLESCGEPVASWLAYYSSDATAPPDPSGELMRAHYLELNRCEEPPAPEVVGDCTWYQGCAEGAPFTYCVTQDNNGHNPRSATIVPQVWEFFTGL